MIGGVTRRMLPHLSGNPHLHVNRPVVGTASWVLIGTLGSLSNHDDDHNDDFKKQ